MSGEREPFLRTVGLVKSYAGVRAVDGVSLSFFPGEIVGLVGKNGAGKSTFIKALSGLVDPDDGEILIAGERVSHSSPHKAQQRGVVLVPQELSAADSLSVAENVELGLGYPKRFGVFVDRRELRRRTAAVLARLEAEIDPSFPVARLSAAQQRLVMIARGLATDARVLILDEPSASLTPEEIRHLHMVLRTLRADGVSIVYVSHRLDEIETLTDRVVVMRDGALVWEGATETLDRRTLVSQITGESVAELREEFAERPALRGAPSAPVVLAVAGLGRRGVVDDAAFSVHAGEVVGIAGLVGAGRTELVRLIAGADAADSGTIEVDGRPVRIRSPRDAVRLGVALLPEDRKRQGNIEAFGVTENITLPTLGRFRARAGLPFPSRRRERRRAAELVERLRIQTRSLGQSVATLSGGNQQKVIVARWIERDPKVLIFDEPTVGIDVGAKAEIYRLIESLADRGKGVLVVSSDFEELVAICHRVLVMREGRIVGELDGDSVNEDEILAACYETAS